MFVKENPDRKKKKKNYKEESATSTDTAQKMKFFIKDFFNTEEILNGKLPFLCSEM